ncbi:hypothetical protein DICVIV_11593 [Dictyocaulus viviparus]|uniref:Uncharacterized protein n=1 Tax=Dictyocaulus viviparus TaxID=29172 RepID=A0A0D8XFA2_DICVI|nr:hypothetical protein DICVIV_11593 [Dictyocaulus viviparus]
MGNSKDALEPFVPHHLDDITVLGKYAVLVCLLTELAFLSQLSNTMYMVYAGKRKQLMAIVLRYIQYEARLTINSN